MARDLFIDLTNNRLAASETNLAPAGNISFVKGDTGAWNLYFLEATGTINQPFVVVDKSAASVKLGIGSRTETPTSGTWSLTFGGDTATGVSYAATAGAIQTALNALTAISSAGGVTVEGSLENHFTVRFNTAGTRGPITANVSELIPDTVAVIDERIAGTASVKEIQEIQLRLTPAVYQPTWTNLSTTVTATIATSVTGSSTVNEVQRLSFSQNPFAGTYRLTMPADYIDDELPSYFTAVTNGVFQLSLITYNHGLTINQPVKIGWTNPTTITGLQKNNTYYVKTIPNPYQLTVAATAGGTLITASAITDFGFETVLRQTAPISASASAADVQAALEALDSIGAGGVIVTGIPGEYYDITFAGLKGYFDQPELTVQNSTTANPGKTANVDFATFALRDLLGNETLANLELEIEIVESGQRTTVVLAPCTVSEELIDADAFSPTVGYPSYIFQALTAAATNATTSLVAITGLNWTAQANSQYLVEWGLLCTDAATADFDGQITAPTGATIYGRWIDQDVVNEDTISSSNDLSLRNEFLTGDGDTYFATQKGYITTGSTAGTVSFKFAKNIAGITATAQEISTGSWVRVEKVA